MAKAPHSRNTLRWSDSGSVTALERGLARDPRSPIWTFADDYLERAGAALARAEPVVLQRDASRQAAQAAQTP